MRTSVTRKRSAWQKAFLGSHEAVALFGLAIILIICGGFAGIALIINVGQNAAKNRAVEANGGYGTAENPIPAGVWINFSDANVRPVRMIYPANNRMRELNVLNPLPDDNMNYVMVFFEVQCKVQHCNRNGTGFQLVSNRGKLWEETLSLLYYEDNLDLEFGGRGDQYDGWQVFQFPQDETITAIRIKWANSPWLYIQPPVAERS